MTLCFICVSNGVKTSGKIAIYTGLLPYIILFFLLIRGLTLPGSFNGIYYLFKPDFSKIWNMQIWNEAIG
jgi:SNF family Na+-dependent transporter